MENELKGSLEDLMNKMENHSIDLNKEIDEARERVITLESLQEDAEDIITRLGSLDSDIDDFFAKMEEVVDL
jgi:predicted  nucleic acid-binding Zn-ribbon protein